MRDEFSAGLGARLREVRRRLGLSLHEVEVTSRGRFKAVVVGSYERGDRSVTVKRLAELAEFYQVAPAALLPGAAAETGRRADDGRAWLRVDVDRLAACGDLEADGPALAAWLTSLARRRDAVAARVVALRRDDLPTLADLYDEQPADLIARLARCGALA